MGLHGRNLRDTDFTGNHLQGATGNPGAAAPLVSAKVGLWAFAVVMLVLAVANGIGHR